LAKQCAANASSASLLRDPLVPDDEVSLISQEIHKDVSFQNHSKAPFVPEVSTFEKPPTGQFDRNRYSTSQDIDIKIKRHNQTCSQEGGISEDLNTIFQNLKQEIARQGTLAGTIIKSCSIVQVKATDSFTMISIDAGNIRYRQVLDVCLRKKLAALFKREIRREVFQDFFSS